MFGVLAQGRLPQTLEQIAADRFALQLNGVEDVNSIAIFLTGQAPFPEGFGASIHLLLPGKEWKVIGGLSNAKPSAFFKLRGLGSSAASSDEHTRALVAPSGQRLQLDGSQTDTKSSAMIGILCEPLENVEKQWNSLVVSRPAANTAVQMYERLATSLLDHVLSFAKQIPQSTGSFVNIGAIENWYNTLVAKGDMQATEAGGKVAAHLFAIASPSAQVAPDGSGSYVDVKIIEQWYKNFTHKIKATGSVE